MLRILLATIILFAQTTLLFGQNCEWLEVGGSAGRDELRKVVVDEQGDIIAASQFNANFSIGSINLTTPTNQNNSFIIKYDPDGIVKWVRQTSTTGTSSCLFSSIATDKASNIYALGQYNGTVNFGNNLSLSTNNSSDRRVVLIKYNSNGLPQWVRDIGSATSTATITTPGELIVNSQGKVVISFLYFGTVGIAGTSQQLTSSGSTDVGVVTYSNTGAYLNARSFGGPVGEAISSASADALGHTYFSFYLTGSITFGSNNYAANQYFLFKLDSALNTVNVKAFDLKFSSAASRGISVASDSIGRLAVVGVFRDTLRIDNFNLVARNGLTGRNLFLAFLDANLDTRWVRQENSNSSSAYLEPRAGITFRNGFIYFGGSLLNASTSMGGLPIVYQPGNTSAVLAQNNSFVIKADSLSNFLWAYTSPYSESASLATDVDGNAVLGGRFFDTITIFNQTKITNQSWDFFVAKLVDNSITRGFISAGPYCAGDSIIIPYTITGTYDTSNFFIAQLSDSAGNFEGLERELGRVKSDSAGIIKGSLPLFDVSTNNQYRIRILSTNPPVQSFFRRDSLRLLIFSKDSADAGPDQTICLGQSFRLSSKGGSRWQWSPAQGLLNPNDSNNRNPLAAPRVNTQYRVIISDSSGCGVTDTAFVTLFVRDSLQANITGPTRTCRGQSIQLQANIQGGDNTYWYQWKMVPQPAVLANTRILNVNPINNVQYRLIYGDSCTPKIDSIIFNVAVDTFIQASVSGDSLVCKGSIAVLQAQGSGCNPSQYQYFWYDSLQPQNLLSTSPTYQQRMDKATTFMMVLKDSGTIITDTVFYRVHVDTLFQVSLPPDTTLCQGQQLSLSPNIFSCDTSQLRYRWSTGDTTASILFTAAVSSSVQVRIINLFNGLSDSAQININVLDPLRLTLLPDTSLCEGQALQLQAAVSGGNPNAYSVSWYQGSTLIDTGLTLNWQNPQSGNLTAKVEDFCSLLSDSAFVNVTVRAPLSLLVNPADTLICFGNDILFTASGFGGDSSQYLFTWTLPNGSRQQSPQLSLSNVQISQSIKVSLTDQCSPFDDSSQVELRVRNPLKADFSGNTSLCHLEQLQLNALANGGNPNAYRFEWLLPDGTIQNQNSLQLIADTSFNLRLVVSDACSQPGFDTLVIPILVPTPIQIQSLPAINVCEGSTFGFEPAIISSSGSNLQFAWSGSNLTGMNNQRNLSTTADKPSIYTYQLVAFDNCAKADTQNFEVSVQAKPIANFTLSDTAACSPLNLLVFDQSIGADSTKNQWQITGAENQSFNGSLSLPLSLTQSGNYQISLIAVNTFNCLDSQTRSINVYPLPDADIALENPLKINYIQEPINVINRSTGANFYTWQIADSLVNSSTLSPFTLLFSDTGTYLLTLRAQNPFNCADQDTLFIIIKDPFTYFIPNAFTPNLDGLNPLFAPITSGSVAYDLSIYNRWGQQVYDCNCASGCTTPCSWNGTFNGEPLPDGVYLYQIRFKSDQNQVKFVRGTVQLLR